MPTTTSPPKTILITGAARGIGLATAYQFNRIYPTDNVILADLSVYQTTAEYQIRTSFLYPDHATFLPVDIMDWGQMTTLFRTIVERYGGLDVVVANAGVMESKPVLDLEDVDEETGELKESVEAWWVLDVNLKGTVNSMCCWFDLWVLRGNLLVVGHEALRLAMYHMKENERPGSVVLVTSTSGYFGGTGVTAYVASKHGVVGLLRASQVTAQKYGIRVNAVAPFMTPTTMTAGLAQRWKDAGLETNAPDRVAEVIEQIALDTTRRGSCTLVAGKYLREMESTRAELLPTWLGEDVAGFMGKAMRFITDIGGYVLPGRN
ncbi:short chain dehydrogenase/reductase [Aspergillus sclerotioniger CBS 115572]|uniref:Short chain dehydrogenase/reductase n=1 Tax=Aspergillus sclerotioniger CBS 115572 TaxID=1450535 RepID=A0A317X649_9EURO|nr:short chain dehydrogenase/reductase [Aspergillus sclerotioniger CBS 115572]PWY94106.1 short chain dehydrogenase/reductase [Aspergillus sclerotioniger CBS 115572]